VWQEKDQILSSFMYDLIKGKSHGEFFLSQI